MSNTGMDHVELTVEQGEERIDVFLANALHKSRAYIQKLLKDGLVLVDGKIVKANYKTTEGDIVEVTFPEIIEISAKPQDLPIDVIYEDEWVIVINKGVGMAVHPAPGSPEGTLVNALMYHTKDLSAIGGVIRPGIVHRIDKDTTGLLVVAKNDEAHRFLSEEIKNHFVMRTYVTIVKGNVKDDSGTIKTQIGRHPKDRKKMAVVKEGREAITHYTVLRRYGNYTLLQVNLETGRTHQIRVHMHHINHPIVGDPIYGFSQNEFGLKRQALHASILSFIHPKNKVMKSFVAPMAEDIKKIIETLEKRINLK